MKNNKAVTLVSLAITIVVLIIISSITTTIGKDVIKQAKLQDLRTNMLLIQAKAKIYVEEVNFQTANLDETKEEDKTKINEIKSQNLKGIALENCEESIKNAATEIGIDNSLNDFYYLSPDTLKEMGINIEVPEGAYYLVKYDFSNTEVIFTNGFKYDGQMYYKLSELSQIEI